MAVAELPPEQAWDEQGLLPWERRPDESAQAYEAFSAYRDMGYARSLSSVADQLQKRRELMGRWSRRWQWVERCKLWDREIERQQAAESMDAQRDMREYHARLARLVLDSVTKRLLGVTGTDESGNEVEIVKALDPSELSPSEMARLIAEASKLERLSRGEATEITETHGEELDRPRVDIHALVAANPDLALKMRELAFDIDEVRELPAAPID